MNDDNVVVYDDERFGWDVMIFCMGYISKTMSGTGMGCGVETCTREHKLAKHTALQALLAFCALQPYDLGLI